jgi:hypothetical protein
MLPRPRIHFAGLHSRDVDHPIRGPVDAVETTYVPEYCGMAVKSYCKISFTFPTHFPSHFVT